MTVTDAELTTLATSSRHHRLGVAADEVRRQRHGTRTTFVRVADLDVLPGAPTGIPETAGEVRIVGVPADRASAVQRITEVVGGIAGDRRFPGFSLADLETLASKEQVPLRTLLEELKQAGLELIAQAAVRPSARSRGWLSRK